MHTNEYGEPVADDLSDKRTQPIERLRFMCERDHVCYADGATMEQLVMLLHALPKHADGKAIADRLRPTPGQPCAWIGSGDDDIEYPA